MGRKIDGQTSGPILIAAFWRRDVEIALPAAFFVP